MRETQIISTEDPHLTPKTVVKEEKKRKLIKFRQLGTRQRPEGTRPPASSSKFSGTELYCESLRIKLWREKESQQIVLYYLLFLVCGLRVFFLLSVEAICSTRQMGQTKNFCPSASNHSFILQRKA